MSLIPFLVVERWLVPTVVSCMRNLTNRLSLPCLPPRQIRFEPITSIAPRCHIVLPALLPFLCTTATSSPRTVRSCYCFLCDLGILSTNTTDYERLLRAKSLKLDTSSHSRRGGEAFPSREKGVRERKPVCYSAHIRLMRVEVARVCTDVSCRGLGTRGMTVKELEGAANSG